MRILLILPILFISCQESKFKVGDCVQKPDEMFKYKVTKNDNNNSKLESLNGGLLTHADLSAGMWTLTSCN